MSDETNKPTELYAAPRELVATMATAAMIESATRGLVTAADETIGPQDVRSRVQALLDEYASVPDLMSTEPIVIMGEGNRMTVTIPGPFTQVTSLGREEMAQPTSDQCSADADLPARDGWRRFATWHPQWGGYAGACTVEFSRHTSDGEFPRSDEDGGRPTTYHYCAPEQVVSFGLLVIERMAAEQVTSGPVREGDPPQGAPIRLDRGWLEETKRRIEVLIERETRR